MTYFWLTYAAVMGCVIGSFLNVCIYRIPLGLDLAKGRSFCTNCKTTIAPYDMIPVLSYLFLRGRCRRCKSHISLQYPLIEGLTGLLFLLSFLSWGFTLYGALLCLFFCCLIVVAMIDQHTMEIPNVLQVCILVLALMNLALNPADWLSHLIGFAAISLPMLLLAILTDGFGGGDIKLCAVCGLFLGWQQILIGSLIACILGAIWAVILIVKNKATKKSAMPFGPFLCTGFVISALYGSQIIESYLNYIGLV